MSTCDGRTGIFLFNDTATTEIYTLSLHDALPILVMSHDVGGAQDTYRTIYMHMRNGATADCAAAWSVSEPYVRSDRKSTRLNSSHANISYAVFCLKKKTNPHTSLLISFLHLYTFL